MLDCNVNYAFRKKERIVGLGNYNYKVKKNNMAMIQK